MARNRRSGPLRRDERGQMMMLSAIVLLIGFVALAGMVARVNQLGAQTGTESRRAILDEVAPLSDALDVGVASLAKRSVSASWTSAGVITASTATFTAADIGLTVSGGSGGGAIPAGAKIVSVGSATQATFTPAPSANQASTTLTIRKPGFALDETTNPTIETGVVALLEQLQLNAAHHGLWMKWQILCGTGGTTLTGSYAVVQLTDGSVVVELRSTVTFTRTTACATALTG